MKNSKTLISKLQGNTNTTKKFIYKKSANNELLKFSIEDITVGDMEILEGYNVVIDGDQKYPHLISVSI